MRHRILTTGATAILAALALAGTASADSISFMRGGDIWVASPDGKQQVQVTKTGGYSYQSQADDGTFIALHGRRLHKIARDGRVLADFDTPVSGEKTDDNTSYFRGPFEPEISPDGTKVAYQYFHQAYYNDPGCYPVGAPHCQDGRVSTGIGYSHSDRQTSWDEPGLGRQSGWTDPSWIGNDTVLLSDKSVRPNLDAMLDHPGDGNQTIQGWFEDTNAWYLKDGEVSRRGDAVAFVSTKPRHASETLGSDDLVSIYRLTGAPPELPEPCYAYGLAEGTYNSPTFSPDGSKLAFSDYSGDFKRILVAEIPNLSAGCTLPSAGGTVVLEDALQPDWGPAGVPTGSTTTPQPQPPAQAQPKPLPIPGGAGGQKPGGAAGPQSGGSDAGAATDRAVTVSAARTSLKKALRKGLALKVAVPGTGTVRVRALRGRRVAATGTARAGAAGDAAVTLKFSRAARRLLARKGRVSLSLRVTFQPAGGDAIQTTRKVVLK